MGRIIWLASFPKSGNTWMRAFLHNLMRDPKATSGYDINRLGEFSFYTNYVVVGLILAAIAFLIVRRLERSWVGLNLDAVRLDETACAGFGIDVARWKILAFYAPTLKAWALGLRATGTAKRFSDLDLALEGEGPVDYQTISQPRQPSMCGMPSS